MPNFNKVVYLYRMVHVENIPHITKFGITHKNSTNANPNFKALGDNSLIDTRRDFELENGKLLGDYIPFYFAFRTPMLFVIQKGFNGVEAKSAEEIVYCVSSVQKILDLGLDFVFTDGHALSQLTTRYNSKDVYNLETILDWQAIRERFWKSESNPDLDLKRRKEAEFLILGDIPFEGILGFVVYNEVAKTELIKIGIDSTKIAVKPDFYF